MKNRIYPINIPEVLILTKKGGAYGMGHYNRVKLLEEHLSKLNIQSKIELDWDFSFEYPQSNKVVILDSRDDSFPEDIIRRKKNYQYLIAIDNRGQGRNQSDIVWDTLPFPDMTNLEFRTSLKNCILNPLVFQYRARPARGKIIRCRMQDIESGDIQCDLVQYPLKERKLVPIEEFHDRLFNAKSVATYFGQTFFEALYLGKNIYLYDISDYHTKLSDWFMLMIQEQPDIVNLLDGQGLHRLTVFIRSIISGVLDFPVG